MTADAARAAVTDALMGELQALLGDRVTTAAAVRDHHGSGEDYFPVMPPDAVCFVDSTEEVSAIVSLCARDGVPIIPYGTGTSLEGHVAALAGGVCIDMMNMTAAIGAAKPLDMRRNAFIAPSPVNKNERDFGRRTFKSDLRQNYFWIA